MVLKFPASKFLQKQQSAPMGAKTFDINPNEPVPVDTSSWKAFDFIGVGKRNNGKTYRAYAATHANAIVEIVTGHRVDPRDLKPLNHKATECDNVEHYCWECDEWYSGRHSC